MSPGRQGASSGCTLPFYGNSLALKPPEIRMRKSSVNEGNDSSRVRVCVCVARGALGRRQPASSLGHHENDSNFPLGFLTWIPRTRIIALCISTQPTPALGMSTVQAASPVLITVRLGGVLVLGRCSLSWETSRPIWGRERERMARESS